MKESLKEQEEDRDRLLVMLETMQQSHAQLSNEGSRIDEEIQTLMAKRDKILKNATASSEIDSQEQLKKVLIMCTQ